MKSRPFQFGLKAVFGAITGAAAFLAICVAAPMLVTMLAVLMIGMALLAATAAFSFSVVWCAIKFIRPAVRLMESRKATRDTR